MQVRGNQWGVDLVDRGDGHVCFQLKGEDDDNWFDRGNAVSSFWLDDLISVLTITKKMLEQLPDDPSGYGKRFWLKKESTNVQS